MHSTSTARPSRARFRAMLLAPLAALVLTVAACSGLIPDGPAGGTGTATNSPDVSESPDASESPDVTESPEPPEDERPTPREIADGLRIIFVANDVLNFTEAQIMCVAEGLYDSSLTDRELETLASGRDLPSGTGPDNLVDDLLAECLGGSSSGPGNRPSVEEVYEGLVVIFDGYGADLTPAELMCMAEGLVDSELSDQDLRNMADGRDLQTTPGAGQIVEDIGLACLGL